MDYKVLFQKQQDNTYSLFINDEQYHTPLTKFQDIDALSYNVDSFIYCNTRENGRLFTVSINPNQSIFIDIFENDNNIISEIFNFEDFFDIDDFVDPAGGHGLSSHI